jgi:penicillin-binding protein 1A
MSNDKPNNNTTPFPFNNQKPNMNVGTQKRNSVAKKLIAFCIGIFFLGIAGIVAIVLTMRADLPKLVSAADYAPLLVTEVFDRSGVKIGEFSREKRTLVPYQEIPKVVINAFLAAEDSTFFQHGGINYFAIARAMLANLRAGEKVQGASTITQQVARSLVLSREKTYTRKIKEILLSYEMEKNLKKEEILYLYLNQIFLGQNSYGIVVATDTYFNKPLKDITLPEAAILAGLPKAPSVLNPVKNPRLAKERQVYVLHRMAAEKMITDKEAEKAINEPISIYLRKKYAENAPAFMDTIKQILTERLGEDALLDQGLRVHTSIDLAKQLAAQQSVQDGLREHDKRLGFRGPKKNIEPAEEIIQFLLSHRNNLMDEAVSFKVMDANGDYAEYGPLNLSGFAPEAENDKKTTPVKLPTLPDYIKPGQIVDAIVTNVDDAWGLVTVRFAESRGLIDLDTMKWARVPDPNIDTRYPPEVGKPSAVLKKGDVISVKILGAKFFSTRINDKLKDLKRAQGKKYVEPTGLPAFEDYAEVLLEQEPQTEAGLLAIDQKTDDIIAMVGSYIQLPGQLNRTIQTARQTGSSFKSIVFTAALDYGYTPATAILDAPIVFEEEQEVASNDKSDAIIKKWKPTNYTNKFVGDILFRNSLVQSINIPAVKIIEKITVPVGIDYARRLGIFSPLNADYTLALGSSSVRLYEMTKAFAQIGRLGRRARPILIHKVDDKNGQTILENVYMDDRFKEQIQPIEEEFEQRRLAYLAYKKTHSQDGALNPADTKAEEPTAGAKTASGKPLPNPAKEPPIFFQDPDQLLKPETAYVMTSLLQAVVQEDGGTATRARSLGRPVAGKTGTTDEFYDAWFIGYSADIAAGVWMGYDKEQPLGKSEGGGRAALPIWVEFMKASHGESVAKSFPVPDGIVFASIDNETGKLASANSKDVVRQAFVAGSEPQEVQDEGSSSPDETQDFYKEDLSQ